MIATIIYAINPKTATPEEGFTSFSKSPEAALKRRENLEKEIKSGAYKRWLGPWRVQFIDRCLANGWDIQVKSCMIS